MRLNKKYEWTWKPSWLCMKASCVPRLWVSSQLNYHSKTERLLKSPYWIMVVRPSVSSMTFCKKGCSNGIRAWSSATAAPSLKWLSSYLEATALHYVMYRRRRDRMDVTEINLIFLKLASDWWTLAVRIHVLQNLCPPEFNFLCGVICFYQLVTIRWPPIMRAVTETRSR